MQCRPHDRGLMTQYQRVTCVWQTVRRTDSVLTLCICWRAVPMCTSKEVRLYCSIQTLAISFCISNHIIIEVALMLRHYDWLIDWLIDWSPRLWGIMSACVPADIVMMITVPQSVMNTTSTMTSDWSRPCRDLLAALLQVGCFLHFTRTQRANTLDRMHISELDKGRVHPWVRSDWDGSGRDFSLLSGLCIA